MTKRIIVLTLSLCIIISTLFISVNAFFEPFAYKYFDYEDGGTYFSDVDTSVEDPGGDVLPASREILYSIQPNAE